MTSTDCATGVLPLVDAASPVEAHPAQIRPFGASPKRAIKNERRKDEKLERRIERMMTAGGKKNERSAAHLMRVRNKSRAAKITAVADVAKVFKRKKRQYPEGREILEIAEQISISETPTEAITIYPKPKGLAPNFRPITRYGIKNAARQTLLRKSLRHLLPVTSDQFGTRNGGRSTACSRVADAIASKHKYVATCDIANFFASIDRDWLRQHTPHIDAQVATSCMLVDDSHGREQYEFPDIMELFYRKKLYLTDLIHSSRQGLPQGASSSPVIADYIVGLVLSSIRLPAGVLLTNIADNFAITGCDHAAVEDAVELLRGAFERHPAGPFRLTGGEVRRAADGFEFLGYHFKRQRHGVAVRPARKNLAELEHGIAKRVLEIVEGETAEHLSCFLSGWRRAFALYRQADFHICTAVRNCARAFPDRAAEIRQAIRKIEAENARMLAAA